MTNKTPEFTYMTNLELIDLFGRFLDANSLTRLQENYDNAVMYWNDLIETAKDDLDEDTFEIGSQYTIDGNPMLIRF